MLTAALIIIKQKLSLHSAGYDSARMYTMLALHATELNQVYFSFVGC